MAAPYNTYAAAGKPNIDFVCCGQYPARMQCSRSASVSAGIFLMLSPLAAFAHEHRTFTIGDAQYIITIGSIGEPVYIDDKSGVELTVEELAEAPHEGDEHADGDAHAAGTPVEGLEKSLKVEVIAGNRKKTFDLAAQWGVKGSYEAVFFPTVETTYSYRLVGRINNAPLDVTFTCNPAGHPVTEDDAADVKLSEKVTQTLRSGAFGCPRAKADAGFPEEASSLYGLKQSMRAGGVNLGLVGTVLGALGVILGGAALVKGKRQ